MKICAFLICACLSPMISVGVFAARTPVVVRALDAGAVGDGVTDDGPAIQRIVNSSPEGSTVDFGAGKTFLIYRTIELRPNRRYTGTSTIKMEPRAARVGPLLKLRYGRSDNVTIEGLTLDASQGNGILRIGVEGSVKAPARNVVIRNCVFRNTRPYGPGESAIFAPVGLRDSEITGNSFRDCTSCIFVANPHLVTISRNDFDTVIGNAISIVTYNFPFVYGEGLTISHNTGRNLERMAIEIFGAQPGTRMEAPIIANNEFRGWRTSQVKDPYGISVVVGRGARISDNILSGGITGYAIEVGVKEAVVTGNTVLGFPYGIVIQGQPDVTLERNTLREQTQSAIHLSNAAPNPRARILNNTIVNARKFGIGADPNDYGSALIAGNNISRQLGFYPEDNSGSYPFIGIKLDAGLKTPVTLKDNFITQTSTAAARMGFYGIAVFGTCSGCVFEGNAVESKSARAAGVGVFLWYGNFLDNSTFRGNRFLNLADVTNGFTSKRIAASGNSAVKVLRPDPNIIVPVRGRE